jgi:hypothetical protein
MPAVILLSYRELKGGSVQILNHGAPSVLPEAYSLDLLGFNGIKVYLVMYEHRTLLCPY